MSSILYITISKTGVKRSGSDFRKDIEDANE